MSSGTGRDDRDSHRDECFVKIPESRVEMVVTPFRQVILGKADGGAGSRGRGEHR